MVLMSDERPVEVPWVLAGFCADARLLRYIRHKCSRGQCDSGEVFLGADDVAYFVGNAPDDGLNLGRCGEVGRVHSLCDPTDGAAAASSRLSSSNGWSSGAIAVLLAIIIGIFAACIARALVLIRVAHRRQGGPGIYDGTAAIGVQSTDTLQWTTTNSTQYFTWTAGPTPSYTLPTGSYAFNGRQVGGCGTAAQAWNGVLKW